jgi:hypothetical protein
MTLPIIALGNKVLRTVSQSVSASDENITH